MQQQGQMSPQPDTTVSISTSVSMNPLDIFEEMSGLFQRLLVATEPGEPEQNLTLTKWFCNET